jgi:putative transposase
MSLLKACRLFGISRQAIYKRKAYTEKRMSELSQVKDLVIEQRRIMPRLGTRKLHYLLKKDLNRKAIKIGRDGMFDFLRSEHLLVKPKKSYRKTTFSKHWMHKYPNLIKNIKIDDIEKVWVADITYLETEEKTAYLSLITDAYSRKIVGHYLHESLHTEGTAKALKQAIKSRKTSNELIHHSDRGLQYCSGEYQQIRIANKILCSMTDGYDCYQNALAERINGILKEEFITIKPKTVEMARKIVDESIKIYNSKRPHLSLKYKTPNQMHKKKL